MSIKALRYEKYGLTATLVRETIASILCHADPSRVILYGPEAEATTMNARMSISLWRAFPIRRFSRIIWRMRCRRCESLT